jgi:PPK2 family polyphosphate:nucleotide phosphotransferase
MNHAEFAKHYEVTNGKKFRLKDYDSGDTSKLKSKEHAQQALQEGIQEMSRLQDLLYADNHWALLLIFQAMDAAGKDSAIKHVMSGVNPQGCQVFSFKAPSHEELDHDFLWRTTLCLPERGRIGIFNRSYYEEVLVVRVHPEMLQAQNIPDKLFDKDRIWKGRFEDINSFERHMARNGTVIRKFFLNVSKEEQRRRFLKRLDEPEKHWKFEASDLRERQHWDKYMAAYEDAIRHTSTPESPWYVIPADHKWFTRIAVASVIIHTLQSLDLSSPKVSGQKKKELAAARKELEGEK